MAERSPNSAAARFLSELRGVLLHVTSAHVIGYPTDEARLHYVSSFQQPTPAFLGGRHGVSIHFRHEYEVFSVGPSRRQWEARTSGYIYTLYAAAGDAVLGYHWHDDGRSRVTWPHVHVYGTALDIPFGRIHLPTGDVGPDAILRCLINDMGIRER